MERRWRQAHLEVLDEIVEHTETIRVLRVLDVDERSNLGRLKRDVVVSDPDLELLLADNVLLGPFGVVLPGRRVKKSESISCRASTEGAKVGHSLDNLRGLDYPLDLFDEKRANVHWKKDQVVFVSGHSQR